MTVRGPPSSRTVPGVAGRGRGGPALWASVTLAGVAALIVAVPGARSAATVRAPTGQAAAPIPALPRLGHAKAVEHDDVGDPFVLPVPGPDARYVLFWTTDWESNVPTAVSTDLEHWRRVDDALPVLPSWATPSRTMTWGPAALQVAAGWVLYYSTQEAATGLECLGRAVAARPEGPYVDASASPLVCQRSMGGDIDPSVGRDDAGRPSLVWKNDGNARGAPTSLWQQTLSDDGLSTVAEPHRLLDVDQPWEHGIVEGPSMRSATGGGWWLFYSAGVWQSTTYSTGVAWCAAVSGPCRKPPTGPLLSSAPGVVSPGGFETFTDHRGQLWATWSAFPASPATPQAAMAMNRVLELAPVLAR